MKQVLSTNGTGSVQAWITGFSRLAAAYSALAQSAPSNVKNDIDQLAASSGYTATELARLTPTTKQQLDADLKTILATETSRYGDLSRQTNDVVASARDTCGVALG